MYIELHCHSAFSFLDGASLPEQLALTASQLGYPALALTDHHGLYGSMAFAQEAKQLGFQAITGAELMTFLAIIYAWTGEKDLALKELTSLLEIPGHLSYGQLRLHPYWDPLRDDPRFDKLIAEAQKSVALT